MEVARTYSKFWGGFAKIYALCDTRGVPFYIGCTTMPVSERLKHHLSEAKVRTNSTHPKIVKIRSLGFAITVKTLDIMWVTGEKCQWAIHRAGELERRWIQKHIRDGFALTNKPRGILGAVEVARKTSAFQDDYEMWADRQAKAAQK